MPGISEFKVILVGEINVGKTSLIVRFVDDKFYEHPKATIRVDIKTVTLNINGEECLVNILDTGGQETYYSLGNSFFRKTDGVIFVYDETRPDTFEKIPSWFHCIEENCGDEVVKILAGNKADDETKKRVLNSRVKAFSAGKNVEVIKTSAKNGANVKEVFLRLIKLMATSKGIVKAGEEPVVQVVESSKELLTAMDQSKKSYEKEKRSRFVAKYFDNLKGIRFSPAPEHDTLRLTQSTQTEQSDDTSCHCTLI